jgi:pimeloyl-ACP methyl ester carboxylesterase
VLVTRPSCFPEGYVGCSARDVALADGTRLRLVESGDAHAPPVLLVHGFGASAYQWRFTLPVLAAAGFHAIAPDLPGHGFSQLAFPNGEYTRDRYARRLWLLLDALGVTSAPVVGHSMGGAIAAEMGWQQPGRLSRLALLSPAGFGLVPERIRLLRYFPDLLAPLARPLASRAAATLVLGDVYGPDGSWTARDEAELLAPYAQPGIYRALLRTLKEFDFSLHSNAQLTQLPRGTLIVFGTHDAVVRAMDIAARVRLVPEGRLVVLSRIGHLPQVEAAEEVGRLLVDFAQGTRVAGAVSAH